MAEAPTTPSERSVRRLAGRRGYRVTKSRSSPSLDNCGEYCLVDDRNHCVLGARYDASLADIVDYLRQIDRSRNATKHKRGSR
jgi:hypothetical protein